MVVARRSAWRTRRALEREIAAVCRKMALSFIHNIAIAEPCLISPGLRNSLFLNGAKNARNGLYLMSLSTLSRAFVSLSGMPFVSSR
jgi:hypothetical protein